MKNTIGVVVALGFITLSILMAVTGCGVSKSVSGPSELKPVEVKEYQGEKLSSVNDFMENSINGPQYVDKEKYRLVVTGLVANPKEYTYEQVITSYKSYQKVITLNCVEGWSVKLLWEGLLLKDLLAEVSPSPNAKVVIFHAYDGYTTSLPLDYVVGKDLILAYKMNDAAIPPERGFPFQLAAESKWGYKWIKWVTRIELSDDINYKGYWEERGYSNDGSLDKGFFGK